jgi:ubiquinone/menaquinone biosynthesis C-methylase UbiE
MSQIEHLGRVKEEKMEIENIREQFDLVANEYDVQRKIFIPCFQDYYQTMACFISGSIEQPKSILDLGAGTGLLTKCFYDQFPDSNFILVDVSEQMLEVARKRFRGLSNFNYIVSDYGKTLPNANFDLVISGLSIHHLSENDKQHLFNNIYSQLPQNGCFANFDQFNAESEIINDMYNSWWYESIKISALPEKEYQKWLKRRQLDQENTIVESKAMVKNSGFKIVECIYCYMKFGVIVARKIA